MSFTETGLEQLSTQRRGRPATAQPAGTIDVAENGRAAFVIDDFASVQPR